MNERVLRDSYLEIYSSPASETLRSEPLVVLVLCNCTADIGQSQQTPMHRAVIQEGPEDSSIVKAAQKKNI